METPPVPSLAALEHQAGRLGARHLDRTFRLVLRGEGVSRDNRCVRLLTGQPHPFGNLTVVSDLTDPAPIEKEIDALAIVAAPAAMLFVDEVPEPVAAHLLRRGFQCAPPMPVMAVDIDRLPEPTLPGGCALVRVEAGPQGTVWEEVFARGYELPLPVAAYFAPNRVSATLDPGEAIQFFLVTCEGRPVATTVCCLLDGVAGVYCVATLPEERRKGFGAFATAEPLRLARRRGYRVGVLQSSESGHPVYRRLGFQDVGSVALHVHMPGA